MSWFDLKLGNITFKSVLGEACQNEFSDYALSDFSGWVYLTFVLAFILSICAFLLYFRKFISSRPMEWRVLAVVSFVVIVYVVYLVFLLWNISIVDVPDWARRGEFGDSFGTLNALFSGLAFSGVLLTLLFQRKDIASTKQQLIDQAFESQFYSLLNYQQEIVKNFDIQDPDSKVVISQGRDCFKRWDQFLRFRFWNYDKIPEKKSKAHVFAYCEVAPEHGSDWDLYFNSLMLLFSVIKDSKHPKENDFAFIVRALLSAYELKLIFYYCLTPGGERLSFFVDRYSLFSHLDDSLIYKTEHLKCLSLIHI